MSRSVPEWIGSSPDAKVPPRVRVRIFEREHGVCHLSGRKIAAGEPWELDHVVALTNGGTHSESNLKPALIAKHKEKTARDVAEKAAVYAKRSKHIGARERKPWPKRPKRPTEPQRKASAPLNKALPPRRITT